jgi:hypothetical protein
VVGLPLQYGDLPSNKASLVFAFAWIAAQTYSAWCFSTLHFLYKNPFDFGLISGFNASKCLFKFLN